MNEPWIAIAADIRRRREGIDHAAFAAAMHGIEQVALFISRGQLNYGLHGWTSMHDLCIQQSDVTPYSGPYLRLSPSESGEIQFRYVDTQVDDRQWKRTVLPEQAVERLSAFMEQLHWVAKRSHSSRALDD